jgi:hypothetical protein
MVAARPSLPVKRRTFSAAAGPASEIVMPIPRAAIVVSNLTMMEPPL